MSNTAWIIIAFACYLLGMLLIGFSYMKRTKNSEDFFLGGRGLSGWVAALSAQASDMSGWLLMGLPGAVYSLGTGQIWIAVGLFIGTALNWIFVAKRLRRYTIRANNSLTLPKYLENRFHDKHRVLLLISSVAILIFFLVYTASGLAAGGKLFNSVFGFDYKVCLTIGTIVILSYTFMGGFMAVCVTDFIQGLLMLVGVITVPIIAFMLVGAGNVMDNISATGVDSKAYFDLFSSADGTSYTFVDIISQLGWALGYFGMPHIIVRFMAIKNEKEIKKSKVIGISWCALSLAFACIIGVVGRAYLPKLLDGASSENVFIEMIQRVFNKDIGIAFIGGIFLCGILAAIMSTADSQLLVTASSVSEDIYHSIINKKASAKKVLLISRLTVMAVAVTAYIIALDPNSSVMGLVSDAWAGLGASFGPIVLMSLYWKRTNLAGAVAGISSGAVTVIVWDYIKFGGKTLADTTGLYSLVIGFAISLAAIIIASLCTKAPNEEILKEFADVKNGIDCGCDEQEQTEAAQ